jgi:hypothetical protein
MILKKGTDNEKQHLPAATYVNRPRAAGLKRRRGANAVAICLEQPADEGQRVLVLTQQLNMRYKSHITQTTTPATMIKASHSRSRLVGN